VRDISSVRPGQGLWTTHYEWYTTNAQRKQPAGEKENLTAAAHVLQPRVSQTPYRIRRIRWIGGDTQQKGGVGNREQGAVGHGIKIFFGTCNTKPDTYRTGLLTTRSDLLIIENERIVSRHSGCRCSRAQKSEMRDISKPALVLSSLVHDARLATWHRLLKCPKWNVLSPMYGIILGHSLHVLKRWYLRAWESWCSMFWS
jgi:hypothetical protein